MLLFEAVFEYHLIMPKKRERELDDSAKKRLRQSKLNFHFTPKNKGKKVEPYPEEEVEVVMNEEERAEAQRRRELVASAAERRKQAGSPWTTPPQSPENQEDNDCNLLQQSSPSKASELPSLAGVQSRTTAKSEMLDALSEVDVVQTRTNPAKQDMEGHTYKRTDWYDYVVDRTHKEGECNDELERPSTSKAGYEVIGNPGNEEGEGDCEEGGERSGVNYAEMEPASPTLEYSIYDGDGSQPLFTDSEPVEDEEVTSKVVSTTYWKGSPISELNRAPACSEVLPQMRPTQDHTILFKTPMKADVPPAAFPDDYHDKWDGDHVRMPCSPENLYPVEDQAGRKKVQSRWELIEATLLGAIKNSLDLEEAILTYNARYSQRWNFSALHTLFTEVLDAEETTYFFDKILPGMVNLALQLPKLCTQAIPLLRRQMTHSITMSQQQIASLLANAFFCTFPRRNAQQKKSEYSRFPDINFNRLFEMGKGYKNHRKIEKLKCILTYFRRVTENVPTGTVTISRRALSDLPRWDKSSAHLTRLHMAASGMIEKEGHGMLQMDFANKYIGGGALGFGCVQEEIRFMINPELIVTRLISEVLDDNECIIIKGPEQFSDYSGYANSFKWKGSFKDTTPRDSWGRKETEIVAIDALVIHRYEDQFRPDCLRRELNKAYCGFHGNASPEHLPAIASGNWGCGAFGGDKRVKGLIQMMAAAEAGRDLAYFTFEDKDLCDDMAGMHDFLASQSATVGDLWTNLHRYRTDVLRRSAGASKPKLFPYLYQLYTVCDSDTDEYETETTGEGKTSAGGSLSPNYRAETP